MYGQDTGSNFVFICGLYCIVSSILNILSVVLFEVHFFSVIFHRVVSWVL